MREAIKKFISDNFEDVYDILVEEVYNNCREIENTSIATAFLEELEDFYNDILDSQESLLYESFEHFYNNYEHENNLFVTILDEYTNNYNETIFDYDDMYELLKYEYEE